MTKQTAVSVRVDVRRTLWPKFGGVGFHEFFPMHVKQLTPRIKAEVLHKRWKELNPSFVRLTHQWKPDSPGVRDSKRCTELADAMRLMKQTDTAVYLTTWNPKPTAPNREREAYARAVADELQWLQKRGGESLRWYCMTNELSLHKWGDLKDDLGLFKDYHRLIHAEIRRRKLDIGLLATDASPISRWNTMRWAAANMDGVTEAYGGHHYFNEHDLEDLSIHEFFRDKVRWGAGLARRKRKPFIIGEFGAKQHFGPRFGFKRWDGCAWYNTRREPLVAIQVADAILAAINAGAYALGYWTFADFPDDWGGTRQYANKWGTFHWSGENFSTRDLYYGIAPLTRFFRGPASVIRAQSSDARLRVSAVRHEPAGTVSIALLNRLPRVARVRVKVSGFDGTVFRRHLHDPTAVKRNPFGDLPTHDGVVAVRDGVLQDVIPAQSLAVYTTAFTTERPAAVRGVTVKRVGQGRVRVGWRANREADLCYYRVFRFPAGKKQPGGGRQIGSTVANHFEDDATGATPVMYRVVAVNQSGNVGE